MNGVALLLGDSHGQYVPRVFVNGFDMNLWGVEPEDVELLQKGPEAEYYWDTWEHVLSSAEYSDGMYTYKLYQDGDLFAVCDDLLSDEEYKEFYGVER